MELKRIGTVLSPFQDKFGIPRQSGLVKEVQAEIVMEPEYRNPDAFRGIEGFSHLWILWEFHKAEGKKALTVRPPRLGGNTRMGVFATRSPFRPNSIGLSVVKLEALRMDEKLGPVLVVSGADILSGTPVYDIKPYLPYVDSVPEAVGGFTEETKEHRLEVELSTEAVTAFDHLPEEQQEALLGILREDPRPAYQDDPERVYGMHFFLYEVHFRVEGQKLILLNLEKK